MVSNDATDKFDPEINEIMAQIEATAETAASRERTQMAGKVNKLDLSRVKDLINVASEIIDLLAQKTNGGSEARFISDYVKAAVYHWQPPGIEK